jgi:hypothetical protein
MTFTQVGLIVPTLGPSTSRTGKPGFARLMKFKASRQPLQQSLRYGVIDKDEASEGIFRAGAIIERADADSRSRGRVNLAGYVSNRAASLL